MSDEVLQAIRVTARAAYRNRAHLSEAELDAALVVLEEVEAEREAELASRTLFNRKESRKLQLTLDELLQSEARQ